MHKIYTLYWLSLIIGVAFLLIGIYSLFRGIKRDKVIAIGLFTVCLFIFILANSLIRNHNLKAEKYFGIHELVFFNKSKDYKIEIYPNNKYQIFSDTDTLIIGNWEFIDAKDKTELLLIDGEIFGVNEYTIK